jgi:nucleotide-binding universal stress UspA family protein
MYEKILVPLDGSAVAAQALPVATLMASALHSSLVLLNVIDLPRPGGDTDGPQADAKLARSIFEAELGEVASRNVPVEARLKYGKPATEIIACAQTERAGLIVMATHGRTGLTRIIWGSVTDSVVRQCEIPVLVVRAVDAPRPLTRIRRILVPLDGSPLAESAIPPAAEISRPVGADVILFSIWDTFGYELTMYPHDDIEAEMHERHATAKQYLIEQTEKLTAAGISAHWQLKSGLVVEEIIAAAQKQDVDLIVMSTHARHGLERWIEGTVAGEVLRGSAMPILLIRMPEGEPARPA